MLFDSLDMVLGTTVKVRLLRVLVPLTRPVSGREAARLAGVSHIAQRALEELAAVGVLHRQETPGAYLYTFNRNHLMAPAIAELFGAEHRFTATLFEHLRQLLESAGGVESAMIFGSSARREARPDSDLDLLVVVRDQADRDRMFSALVDVGPDLRSRFGVRLSPVVVTALQLRRQSAEGDPFVTEVRRDARRICGRSIEELIDG